MPYNSFNDYGFNESHTFESIAQVEGWKYPNYIQNTDSCKGGFYEQINQGLTRLISPIADGDDEPVFSSNKILYTSSNGNVVNPYASGTNIFGANIVSNTMSEGQGIITFDGNVTRMGDGAFYKCSSLRNITIPDSVTIIGGYAFKDCSSLTDIIIPDSVKSIGQNAFNFGNSTNSALSGVVIGNSITTISDNSFSNCKALRNLTIGNSVVTIGQFAFYNCSVLREVVIPNTVRNIGNSVFNGCVSLTSITIPNSVTSIGNYTFKDCTSLTYITITAPNPPSINATTFNNTGSCPIYVPYDSVNTYKQTTGWSTYAARIQAMPI